jgi:hypothetical protein
MATNLIGDSRHEKRNTPRGRMSAREPGDPRCKDCPADHEPGKSRCAACAEKHRIAARERVAALKAAGKCVVCGKRAAKRKGDGVIGTLCATHRTYYADRA